VIYDHYGYFACQIRTYGAQDLNEEMDSHIQALYKDSKIIADTEVSDLADHAFYVKIQIPHAIKTV
jgi:hypothetical protein